MNKSLILICFQLSIELDLLVVNLLALLYFGGMIFAGNAAAVPQTWPVLKQRMKSHFVPLYYQCDLRLKLQNLKQGDKRVEEYY